MGHFVAPADDPEFNDTVHLFDYGYVDSFGAVDLISFVQERFGMTVSQRGSDLISDEYDFRDRGFRFAAGTRRELKTAGPRREQKMAAIVAPELKSDWFATDLPAKIPSLDGLRALSILCVLFSHAIGTRYFFVKDLGLWGAAGGFGVRIFFVISGFLITTLLLRERAKTGSISIRAFYLRRTFRIFPASYTYLAVITLLILFGGERALPGDLANAATYTMNYHHPHAWIVGHLWSLSVEEQFYLLWPAVVVFAGPARATYCAAAAMLLIPLLRFISSQFFPGLANGQEFHLTADALTTGCVLAAGHKWLSSQSWYLSFLRGKWFFGAPLCAVLLNCLHERPRILGLLGYSVMNVGIALTIDRMARYPDGIAGRVLNTRPIRFIGVLSYSLYLWQQLFLDRTATGWLQAFPVNLLAVGVAACLSYYVVERPFLAFKERFSKV